MRSQLSALKRASASPLTFGIRIIPDMISPAEYKKKSKRFQLVGSLIFLIIGGGTLIPLTLVVGRPDGLATSIQNALAPHIHPDFIGLVGTIPLIPLLLLPILVAIWLVAAIDRLIGLPCPKCGKSLTMRCRHAIVLNTRRCGLCGEIVLEEISGAEQARPGSPPQGVGSADP